MAQFRKGPVVVTAWQWTGVSAMLDGMERVFGPEPKPIVLVGSLLKIDTPEGRKSAEPGDWIIRGPKGEFYPCPAQEFYATYEPADMPARGQAGHWEVQRRVERGASAGEPVEVPVDAEPVPGRREVTWLVAEICDSMEEANRRARDRASMGQVTRVVHRSGGGPNVEPSGPAECPLE